ncbi:MAG: hypothetical protein M0T74_09915 [Desulfitobacterium hafniense]|nr:hypothetical protein [Desulfitobacterium hafniense]
MNGKMPDLAAYAGKLELYSLQVLTDTNWEQIGKTLLNYISSACQARGCLIGHIKGFMNLGEAGYYYLSNVSSDQETSSRGEGRGNTSKSYLDLNVLVYGIEKFELNDLVSRTTANLADLFSLTYNVQEAHHEHTHLLQIDSSN